MAEMFERQPADVQSLLLRTSVAERLNGQLADLLAGRPGCEAILLALEDANAFVVSLDAQRTWFGSTSFWRISCAWNCAERWLPKFLISTARPPPGSSVTVRWSRPFDTRWRPATGPTQPVYSVTTCSA